MRLANKSDWQNVLSAVKQLAWTRDGKNIVYDVQIKEVKSTRTYEQNARYWALMTAISVQAPPHMGGEWHSPQVWHEYCKTRFLGVDAGPFGAGVAKSTAKLSINDFMAYMEEAEAWAYQQFDGFDFEFKEVA